MISVLGLTGSKAKSQKPCLQQLWNNHQAAKHMHLDTESGVVAAGYKLVTHEAKGQNSQFEASVDYIK